MAATDWIFYYDYRDQKRHRHRLYLKTAAGAAVGTLDPVLEPGFEEDPAVGSNFKRIHRGIRVPKPKEAQFRFEKWPVGLAMAPIYDVEVDYDAICYDDAGQVDALLVELSSAIRRHTIEAAKTVSHGVWSKSIDSANWWLITSDAGDTTATPEEFRRTFEGVQTRARTKEGKLTPNRTLRQTITLTHITKAAMGGLSMLDLSTAVRGMASFGSGGRYSTAWETAFKHTVSGSEYRIQAVQRLDGCDVEYWRLSEIYSTIRQMAAQAVRVLRRSNLTPNLVFSSSGVANDANPYDLWIFAKQGYTRSAYIGTLLGRNDIYVQGVIRLEGVAKGGLFVDDGSGVTLAKADYTTWDFISDTSSATLCRATIRASTSDTGFILHFARPYEAAETRTINAVDILAPKEDQPAVVEVIESYGAVTNVTVEVADATDKCVRTIRKTRRGSASEEGGTVKLVFDNHPTIGATNDWTAVDGGTIESDGSLSYTAGIARFFPFKLYYFDDPFASGQQAPFRVHHVTNMKTGLAGYDAELDLGIETFVADNEDRPITIWGGGTGFRDALVDIRLESSRQMLTFPMGKAVGAMASVLFGNDKMTRFAMRVPMSVADLDCGNVEYVLGAADIDGRHSAQGLLADAGAGIDASDLLGRGFAVGIKLDEDLHQTELELITLRR